MPAYAHHFRIPAVRDLVLQTRYAFTSATPDVRDFRPQA
jgi:hypothetical protein